MPLPAEPVPLAALSKLALVLPPARNPLRIELESVAAAQDLTLEVAVEVEGIRLIADLVAAGDYASILPETALPPDLGDLRAVAIAQHATAAARDRQRTRRAALARGSCRPRERDGDRRRSRGCAFRQRESGTVTHGTGRNADPRRRRGGEPVTDEQQRRAQPESAPAAPHRHRRLRGGAGGLRDPQPRQRTDRLRGGHRRRAARRGDRDLCALLGFVIGWFIGRRTPQRLAARWPGPDRPA